MKVQPRKRPTGTQSRAARLMVRRSVQAALSTVMAGPPLGAPYGSLVTVATDPRGAPLVLLSDLSDHTRNLKADDRAALLFTEAGGHVNPQEDARVTLMGRLVPDPDPAARDRFLARHPHAALYAGFTDFAVYRMTVSHAHFVGGFGAAAWIDDPADWLVPADLAASVQARAAALGALRDADGWRLVGVDADGIDLAPPAPPDPGPAEKDPGESGRVRRVAFATPLADADALDAAVRSLLRDGAAAGAPAPEARTL
nr:pyridoxamine 5'-phosphate oxidase family protein [Roseospira goensis]